MPSKKIISYQAAGGVVIRREEVLVLLRPADGEVRLPKGHIDPGEDPPTTALREVGEESGYVNVVLGPSLGTQTVTFDWGDKHVVRVEHYFIMSLAPENGEEKEAGEPEFIPTWLPWEQALAELTFEVEREWVRRAKKNWESMP